MANTTERDIHLLIQDLAAQIAGLTTQIAGLGIRMDTLSGRVDTLSGRVDTIQSEQIGPDGASSFIPIGDPHSNECCALAPEATAIRVVFCSEPSERSKITDRAFSTIEWTLKPGSQIADLKTDLLNRARSEAGLAGRSDVSEVRLYYIDADSAIAYLLTDKDTVLTKTTLLLHGADTALMAERTRATLGYDLFEKIVNIVDCEGRDHQFEQLAGYVSIRGIACVCNKVEDAADVEDEADEEAISEAVLSGCPMLNCG